MDLAQLLGAGVMLLFLADIFFTVLYARADTGLLAPRWDWLVWAMVSGASRIASRNCSRILSFAGPLIVVSLIAFWALGLTAGAALVICPELGWSIRPINGDTPRDFVTALHVAGNTLSIDGGGDYSPHRPGTRILLLINSLIGTSVLSLVLSYLVQVYSALRKRNARSYAAGLEVLHATGIKTLADPDGYAPQRSQWEPLISNVGAQFGVRDGTGRMPPPSGHGGGNSSL